MAIKTANCKSNAWEILPIVIGESASPKACIIKIWKAKAIDLIFKEVMLIIAAFKLVCMKTKLIAMPKQSKASV